uniref:Cytoplasmic polyadenylation element-binding protein 1 n=1 Tax=Elaeophora elaphi TaxID=1147741 RepID=A0A0R3S4K3_9BILA
MSDQTPSTRRRLPTRHCNQMISDHCFWTTNSSSTNESRSKSTCSSSSVTDDQKGHSFILSGSDRSIKNDSLLDSTVTILDVNESLKNIISEERGENMQQSVNDEKKIRCDNQSEDENSELQPPQSPIESKNKLINRALELAQSLFGPDATVVKTFRALPTQRGINSDNAEIAELEGEEQDEELMKMNERKKEDESSDENKKEGESSTHRTNIIDFFKNRIASSAFSARSSLLHRNDFTALEVLTDIYRNAPVGGTRFVKPTSTTFSYIPQNADPHDELKTEEKTEQSANECDEEVLRRRQRDLMDEYFHRPGGLPGIKSPSGRQEHLWADQKYYEYYEYLYKGIKRALSHPGSFSLDCGAGNVHTPSNQQVNGICRAMKSNLYYQYSPGPEIYSRKVFVGGLPIDIDENELTATFSRFGPLLVDWPNKGENKSYFPPKGYVFLIFEYEVSVRALVQSCFMEDEKLFLYISSPLSPDKLVQIRPWRLADADYVVEASIPLYARRAIFVGGVPRPIKAVELAHIMDRLYGSVGCAGIDTDIEYKYPKGAGRIAFTNQNSYMKAITDRYVQLSHGEVEKRVELKPYVLDDQPCDECGGERCNHRNAPFFCPQLSCLQYYCEKCWTTIHGCRAREDHKPLVKEA